MSDKILQTPFDIDWVLERVFEEQKTRSAIKDWKAKQIGIGQGYMSHIIRLELDWADKNELLPSSLVLKVPAVDTVHKNVSDSFGNEKTKKAFKDDFGLQWLAKTHKNEINTYKLLRTDCPVPMPKLYHGQELTAEQSGILIMQDFSQTCTTINVADGLSLDQVLEVADALASLHAHSLSKTGWENNYWTLNKAILYNIPQIMKATLDALAKTKPEYFNKIFEKISWCSDVDYLDDHVLECHKGLGHGPVLVQGDMWANNLLFDSSSGCLASVIDWQGAKPGCCAEDLARLLISSCTPDMRRTNTDRVLEHYHKQLSKKMGGSSPFTLSEVHKAYEIIFPHSMALFLFGINIMANSPIMDGPTKEQRVEELYYRAKCAIDDCLKLKHWYEKLRDK